MELGEGQPKPVKGYLILNAEGDFLEHNAFSWFDHEGNSKDAFVYSPEQTKDLLEQAKNGNWETKPSFVIEATFDPQKGVIAHERDGKMRIPVSEAFKDK